MTRYWYHVLMFWYHLLVVPWWKYIAAALFGRCPSELLWHYTHSDDHVSLKHRVMYPTIAFSYEFDGLCVDWYCDEYYF